MNNIDREETLEALVTRAKELYDRERYLDWYLIHNQGSLPFRLNLINIEKDATTCLLNILRLRIEQVRRPKP